MPPYEDLTERQRALLSALRRLSDREGFSPSLRELGAEVGLRSPSTVLHHVRILEARGLIDRNAHNPRSIRNPR